jgi:hypothetical protein
MVVPDIVHAVAGQKIQNAAAVFAEQLAAKASFIPHTALSRLSSVTHCGLTYSW